MKNQPNHSERDHSEISPSKLKYLKICPGYESEEFTSEAAERGTKLHEIVDSGIIPESLDNSDREMVKEILELIKKSEEESEFEPLKEVALDFRPLNLPGFEKGHADRVIVLESDDDFPKVVELIDFKFGRWEVEDVRDNLQFRAYAIGLFLAFPSIEEIRGRVIQPACHKDNSYTFIRSRDYDMIVTQISAIVKRRKKWEETKDENLLHADPDVCSFCASQAICPIWQKYLNKVARDADILGHDIVPMSSFSSPMTADPEEVIRAFQWVRPMEEYLKKFKRFALAVYDAGRIDPDDAKVVEKTGKTNILDIVRVQEILQNDHGISELEFIGACDISMTKILDLFPKKEQASVKEELNKKLFAEGLLQFSPPARWLQISRKKKE